VSKDPEFCSHIPSGATVSCNRTPRYALEFDGWLPAGACGREHLAALVGNDRAIDAGVTIVRPLHAASCMIGQHDPIAHRPWGCTCRQHTGPAITRTAVGA
jgi:hypothetical protein